MKKFFVLTLVLVVAMTSLLAIPASASSVVQSFSRPNCGCSATFYGVYSGGLIGLDRGHAMVEVQHDCDSAYAYASLKCWIAPTNNLNNYTSRTFTGSGTNNGLQHGDNNTVAGNASVWVEKDYTNSGYELLGVECHYRVSVTHNGVTSSSQAWSSDGIVPLSYTPPVVTE